MKWFWKVRIYRTDGIYWHANVETERNLSQIDAIQDFYESMTGCKMLLEGMGDMPFSGICSIAEAFNRLWGRGRSRDGDKL